MPNRPPAYSPHRTIVVKRGDQRPSAAARGYDARWQKARKIFLAAHPLCAICVKAGRLTAATVVDHIVAHKGNVELFWDEGNWQSACKTCHDQKTATEDGGFGRGSAQ